jgi:hypothetical protein
VYVPSLNLPSESKTAQSSSDLVSPSVPGPIIISPEKTITGLSNVVSSIFPTCLQTPSLKIQSPSLTPPSAPAALSAPPAVEESAVEESAVEESAVEESAVEESAVEESAVEESPPPPMLSRIAAKSGI